MGSLPPLSLSPCVRLGLSSDGFRCRLSTCRLGRCLPRICRCRFGCRCGHDQRLGCEPNGLRGRVHQVHKTIEALEGPRLASPSRLDAILLDAWITAAPTTYVGDYYNSLSHNLSDKLSLPHCDDAAFESINQFSMLSTLGCHCWFWLRPRRLRVLRRPVHRKH